MFFKRPKFKYGGEAEGLEKVRRMNYQMGSNPFNQGIGLGFTPSQSILNERRMYDQGAFGRTRMQPQRIDFQKLGSVSPFGFMQPGYSNQPVRQEPVYYDEMQDKNETGIGQVRSKMQPQRIDFQKLGSVDPFKFMSPRSQAQSYKDALERKRLVSATDPGIPETTMEQIAKSTPLGDFDKGASREDLVTSGVITKEEKKQLEGKPIEGEITEQVTTGNDIEKAGKEDFDIADNLAKKQLLMSGKVLTDDEEKAALSGEAIPMYEKYLGPQEAETKRRAWLNTAKLGFRLMSKDVSEAGLESAEDFEKLIAEQASLKKLAALKGLDYEKDVKIAALKLANKEPSAYTQKMETFTNGVLQMYPELAKNPNYLKGFVDTTIASEGSYNTSIGAIINRDADYLVAQSQGGAKMEGIEPKPYYYTISKFALVDPNVDVRSNLQEIPTKGDKVDENFQLTPGYYYFSEALDGGKKIFQYTGDATTTVKNGSKLFEPYKSPLGIQYR